MNASADALALNPALWETRPGRPPRLNLEAWRCGRAVNGIPIPDCLDMTCANGAAGSRWFNLRGPTAALRAAADAAAERETPTPRLWLADENAGQLIMLLPSDTHEETARVVDLAVSLACRQWGCAFAGGGSTTFTDPKGRRGEPDCCFYIGLDAEDYEAARALSPGAAKAFRAARPPTLIVEVDVASGSDQKLDLYANWAAPEIWRIWPGRHPAKNPWANVKILILDGNSEPPAYQEADRSPSMGWRMDDLEGALKAVGAARFAALDKLAAESLPYVEIPLRQAEDDVPPPQP